MDETNDLQISLGLDPTPLRQGMSEAERIVQQGSARIQSSIESIGQIGQQLAGLGATLTASITLPLVALGTAAVKAYGDLQALELGIEAVAGSAQFAGKQMAELREIAKLPGLGLKEAAKGSVGLQAIGYSAGNAEKILLQFGNAIATVGKGRVEFERAIYGVQQLANTDFPLGEDLNIIKDALPQVSTLLKAAFGTSRTEDLQKMKVSSKQVMDVIITGLEKLPRVSGGVKNAFENFGDSMQQNLARIGKSIDDNFNISGIINKVTDLLDSLISAFEELSPAMQKTVLIVAALVAGIGPLLLAIGGFLALVPLIVVGIKAIGAAINDTITFMTSWVGIIAGLIIAATALGGAIAYLATKQTEAEENQERWNKSMSKAVASAQAEVAALEKLYTTTQNHNLSLEERNKAVDQLQKEYPGYLGNLSNEAILAGQAAKQTNELKKAIISASLARAAQAELGDREKVRLNKELEIREKLNKAIAAYKDPTFENFEKFKNSVESGFLNFDFAGRAFNPEQITEVTKQFVFKAVKELKSLNKDFDAANKDLYDKITGGAEAMAKLDIPAPDNFLPGLEKVKKETQKQIAEIFPVGSIAELRQRADLLTKSIETSVGGLVKVRGLDKFGKDINKAGLPIFTGEILSLEKARDRLNELKIEIGEIEIVPAKITGRGLLDPVGNEFKTLNDMLSSEAQRTGKILGTDLPFEFTNGADKFKEAVDNAKLEKKFEDLNKSLSQILTSSVVDSISDAFSAIGAAIANGTNVISAVGKSLLSSFGNLLTSFGKQLIEYGIGLIVVKQAIKNPYLAIAAGAALVALGSAFSASVNKTVNDSGIGGGSNVSSSAGTGSSGSFSNTSFSQGGVSGGEVVFRISGPDLIGAINRNVSSESRLNAG